MLKVLNLMFCIHLQKDSFILQFLVWTSLGKEEEIGSMNPGKRHLTLFETLSWALKGGLNACYMLYHIFMNTRHLFSQNFMFLCSSLTHVGQ